MHYIYDALYIWLIIAIWELFKYSQKQSYLMKDGKFYRKKRWYLFKKEITKQEFYDVLRTK